MGTIVTLPMVVEVTPVETEGVGQDTLEIKIVPNCEGPGPEIELGATEGLGTIAEVPETLEIAPCATGGPFLICGAGLATAVLKEPSFNESWA